MVSYYLKDESTFQAMTMSFTRFLVWYMLFLIAGKLFSQDYAVLYEPQLAINHNVSSSYIINFSLASRSGFYENNELNYDHKLVEINHFSTLKLNDFETVSIGIKYRNRDAFNSGKDEIRITQQFNINNRRLVWRFGHRFRTEQRSIDSKLSYRFRYRLALDRPLNGDKLDIGEAYFVIASEVLHSITNTNSPISGNRWSAQIGWAISNNLKVQFGLEHRFDDFFNQVAHSTFLLSSAAIKI